ncbi:MAG TPA: type II toxin-antitoxin system RelE/ParE family toxin [bacterium]|nr:type II toxin-antitoxin system RelE/ParE family toxin [bacterium]
MTFYFHPEAEEEFNNAIDYYEEVQNKLGFDFAFEVYKTIERIIALPKAWPILEDDIRRCLINRFPFGIIYSIEPEGIFILSIMHLKREPDYWKSRMK